MFSTQKTSWDNFYGKIVSSFILFGQGFFQVVSGVLVYAGPNVWEFYLMFLVIVHETASKYI